MVYIFVWCFYQWMDKKAEREDNDSGDYADCDCVIEWRGAGELREDMCCGRREGETKIA